MRSAVYILAALLLTPAASFAATKFYTTHQSAPVAFSFQGTWDCDDASQDSCDETVLSGPVSRRMATFSPDVANTNLTVEKDTGKKPTNAAVLGFVSDVLTAQTISGTLSVVMPVNEGSSTADASMMVHAWVRTSAGGLRCTLVDMVDGVSEMQPTVPVCYAYSAAIDSCAVSTDDRIVVEIGARFNTVGSPRSATFYYGDGQGTDCVGGGGGAGTLAIIEFSGTLGLGPTPTPTTTPTQTPTGPSPTPTRTPTITGTPTCRTPVPTDTPTAIVSPTRKPHRWFFIPPPPVFVTPTPGNTPGAAQRRSEYIEAAELEFSGGCKPPANPHVHGGVKESLGYCSGTNGVIEGHYCFGSEFLPQRPVTVSPKMQATGPISTGTWTAEVSTQVRGHHEEVGVYGAAVEWSKSLSGYAAPDIITEQSPDVSPAGACDDTATMCCLYFRIAITGNPDPADMGYAGVLLNYVANSSG